MTNGVKGMLMFPLTSDQDWIRTV